MAKCTVTYCKARGETPRVKSRNPKAVAKTDPLCGEHLAIAVASGAIWR